MITMTLSLSKIKIPWKAVRIVAILLAALLVAHLTLPYAEGFVEEAHSSKAASKARVLQRGAQIAATERIVAGDSFELAEDYLITESGMKHILKVAGFPVTAVKITDVSLDTKGLLSAFACIVEYEGRRYTVTFDIAGHTGTSNFLELVEVKGKK